MSTQQAPAPNMTENSVIKHYKKQLIYRQHDVPDEPRNETPSHLLNEVSNIKIYDFVESKKNDNSKKIRKKRKNRNCRGQFRHEAMELIKLGANPSHSLCKTKEAFGARLEKPDPAPHKDDRNAPQPKDPSLPRSVIQCNQPILEAPPKPPAHYTHALPQMVPERRNSRELPPPPPPPKVPVIYRSPEYRLHPYPPYAATQPYLPPPPPYPVARSPPRPVPRSPIRPIPQPAANMLPYYGYQRPPEYPERRRRRQEAKEHPVVAAIDLTVDHAGRGGHKCQCECGKTYEGGAKGGSVKVGSVSVPSTYMRGKLVNGVLQFDGGEGGKRGAANGDVRSPPALVPGRVIGQKPSQQTFSIDGLLSKAPRIEPKDKQVPEPSRVIVSTRAVEGPRPKSKDYTVSTIIGDSRRQSVDIDTISISSSGSESVRSPRPKSAGPDKQIPHGKLFYYKSKHSFIRYFDDTEKKLFMDSITAEGSFEKVAEDKQVIELPRNAIFSPNDSLTVEEYVSEMTLVEKHIPKDFFSFYKFVTGYQICNNNLPVSFLTFLKVYNTNGLKILLERYVSSLKN